MCTSDISLYVFDVWGTPRISHWPLGPSSSCRTAINKYRYELLLQIVIEKTFSQCTCAGYGGKGLTNETTLLTTV